MQKVRIFLKPPDAFIKFRYNPDVVEIMRAFNGRYDRKTKLWKIPSDTHKSLYEELKSQMYDVKIIRV